MTAVKTRREYCYDVLEAKNVYLRRPHPKDAVELVIGWGDHTCTVVRLTEDQHKNLTRDSHSLWFSKQVLA